MTKPYRVSISVLSLLFIPIYKWFQQTLTHCWPVNISLK